MLNARRAALRALLALLLSFSGPASGWLPAGPAPAHAGWLRDAIHAEEEHLVIHEAGKLLERRAIGVLRQRATTAEARAPEYEAKGFNRFTNKLVPKNNWALVR